MKNPWRDHFPIFKKHSKLIYLDSAATTQKPQCVIDSLSNFYSSHYATVHRAVYDLSKNASEQYEAVREKVRKFINATSRDEIVFTRGTTSAINLLAHSLSKRLTPKDIILISAIEHHSNIVPWQMICEEKGCSLQIIPVNEKGEILLQDYERMLNQNVKIVSIAHISNAFGTIHPIEKMVSLAHQHGAIFIVDGAQVSGHHSADVQKLNCEFYLFSGHKAYGPTGVGVLYGKNELLESLPPVEGGGDMIEAVTFAKTTYAKPPFRFEGGTPMIAEVIGLGAAIDFLLNIGISAIEAFEQSLLTLATHSLLELPEVSLIGTSTQKSGIISFTVNNHHPLDIGTLLNCRHIALRTGHHCAQPAMAHFNLPAGTSRISFGMYNTAEEVFHFTKHLKEVISTLITR